MTTHARKLTPAHIGQPKVKLQITGDNYSHAGQVSTEKPGVIYMTTWNATQTFNSKGQPNDKDNDK